MSHLLDKKEIKYFLSRNIFHQDKSDKDINTIIKNIKIIKPNWNIQFIENYIISRYPDYYFYNQKLKKQYMRLSRQQREIFRLHIICKNYLCDDILKYIELFI